MAGVNPAGALVPALRPKLDSLALGAGLGVLTTAAVAVVTIFALGGLPSSPWSQPQLAAAPQWLRWPLHSR